MRAKLLVLLVIAAVSTAVAVIISTHRHHDRPCLISSYGPVVGRPGRAYLPGPPPITETC